MKIVEYTSGDAFIEAGEPYDLVFMDIEMKGIDGLETAKVYKSKYKNSLVALLTTHTEYWKQGYAVNVFRYLEKSNIREDIKETLISCHKIYEKRETITVSVPKHPDIALILENIVYLETEKRNVRIHMKHDSVLTNESINELEARLEGKGFMKSHKSCIVNLDEVRSFDDYLIIMKDGSRVALSARNKKKFMDTYMRYKFENANS